MNNAFNDAVGYDVIGDLHGYADELEALLQKMDYRMQDGVYRHPQRKAVFVGDLINRGNRIPDTVEIVKRMVESGEAVAVMGNHEYLQRVILADDACNHAACVAITSEEKTLDLHISFRSQYEALPDGALLRDAHCRFLMGLPLYYSNEMLRVAHACWNPSHITVMDARLKRRGYLALEDMAAVEKEYGVSVFSHAVLDTVKGSRITVDALQGFLDAPLPVAEDAPTSMRVQWWALQDFDAPCPMREVLLDLPDAWREIAVPPEALESYRIVDTDPRPFFFGHYGLDGLPRLVAVRALCVDFGVMHPGGHLAAYRLDRGETRFDLSKMVYVKRTTP